MEPCECKNDNFQCHPASGCICRHGYTGANCEEERISRNVQEKTESSVGSVVAGIFAAVIVIAATLAAWMYHRRRVANLKMEMVQVQYIAEPVTPPDRNHFDNPVYSCQPNSTRTDDATMLLNNGVIRNNLGTKSTNSEKAKMGLGLPGNGACYADDDDSDSCRGAYGQYDHQASLKNKDADLGNPNVNVYHSIDEMDNKKGTEHLYDEIKQNNAELEYDHLDYTRPLGAWKPHYQRMANGFGPSRDGSGSSKSGSTNPQDPEFGGK